MRWEAFADELSKIAVNVPIIHGTSGMWDVLKPAIGSTVLKNDPNSRAVYVAMKNSKKMEGIAQFAREAVKAKGGTPLVAHAKVNTQQGWLPRGLTEWGKKNIGSLDQAHDMVHELDQGAAGPRRGEIWRALHKGTGAWANVDPAAEVKPAFYRPV